jgi:hypothetical protein
VHHILDNKNVSFAPEFRSSESYLEPYVPATPNSLLLRQAELTDPFVGKIRGSTAW